MPELSELVRPVIEPLTADAAAQMTKVNRNALDFMTGAQKVMFEEMMFAGNELLERAQTEAHLMSEFISKMAASHSVKDLKNMAQECAQHQIDFIRRDNERLFKHGERVLEATSKLLANRPQA